MIAPTREIERDIREATSERPRQRARRMEISSLAVRSKEELAPPVPLPRWTTRIVIGWALASVAVYAAILSGAWR